MGSTVTFPCLLCACVCVSKYMENTNFIPYSLIPTSHEPCKAFSLYVLIYNILCPFIMHN